MKLTLPATFAINLRKNGDEIRQQAWPQLTIEGTGAHYENSKISGTVFIPEDTGWDEILVTSAKKNIPDNFKYAVRSDVIVSATTQDIDCSSGEWRKNPGILSESDLKNLPEIAKMAILSWDKAFSYLQENSALKLPGLRSPQIGAVHAIFSHWSIHSWSKSAR
jgi:hypothetical protein